MKTFDCFRCGDEIKTIPHTENNLNNGVWIAVFGGYGAFLETPELAGTESDPIANPMAIELGYPTLSLPLCHDCCVVAFRKFPNLEELIDPRTSHTHGDEGDCYYTSQVENDS